jgi:hypothetical protein
MGSASGALLRSAFTREMESLPFAEPGALCVNSDSAKMVSCLYRFDPILMIENVGRFDHRQWVLPIFHWEKRNTRGWEFFPLFYVTLDLRVFGEMIVTLNRHVVFLFIHACSSFFLLSWGQMAHVDRVYS